MKQVVAEKQGNVLRKKVFSKSLEGAIYVKGVYSTSH
jgi:hypothetical protein